MLTEEEKTKNREISHEKRRKQSKRSLLILGLMFFFLFFAKTIWGPIGVNISYSVGERKVQIVKIASKGLLWKTWEMEGIITPGNGIAMTYIWKFSIDNADPKKNELLQKINSAYAGSKTVNVRYEEKAGSVPWRSKTTYFARDIIIIE